MVKQVKQPRLHLLLVTSFLLTTGFFFIVFRMWPFYASSIVFHNVHNGPKSAVRSNSKRLDPVVTTPKHTVLVVQKGNDFAEVQMERVGHPMRKKFKLVLPSSYEKHGHNNYHGPNGTIIYQAVQVGLEPVD